MTYYHISSLIWGHNTAATVRLVVTERQKRALRERDLNLNALSAVNLLSSALPAPTPQKRTRGEWVDENCSGGELLSYDMMLAAAKVKATVKAQKEANKKSALVGKLAKQDMNLHDK